MLCFGGIRYLIYLLAPIVFFFSCIPPVTSQSSTFPHPYPAIPGSPANLQFRSVRGRLQCAWKRFHRILSVGSTRIVDGSYRDEDQVSDPTEAAPQRTPMHLPLASIGPRFIHAKERMRVQLRVPRVSA